MPFFENGSDRPAAPETLEGLARYCEFMVRYFKGKVRIYEIRNEWAAPSRRIGALGRLGAPK